MAPHGKDPEPDIGSYRDIVPRLQRGGTGPERLFAPDFSPGSSSGPARLRRQLPACSLMPAMRASATYSTSSSDSSEDQGRASVVAAMRSVTGKSPGP